MDSKDKHYREYMNRVKSDQIPAYEPSVGAEELELIADLISRNWVSEGSYTRAFESELSNICERKHALAFANATAAMITGMKCLGIGPGDEVIVPSFTHPADPNSISVIGARPVFADVDETMCLSLDTIKSVLTSRTKAILYVSLYGNVSEIDIIVEYALEKGIKVINDCAPALFGTFKDKKITSYGDIAVLSFFADKTITTGEGGMLLTDDSSIIEEANIYKHDGRRERGYDIIERKGYNFRITEMQSAIGVAQLKKAEHFIQRKRENLQLYIEGLKGVSDVCVFEFNPLGDIVPHRNIIFVPKAEPLIAHLASLGVGVRSMFMPMHSQPCYDEKLDLPVTERLFETGLCLPSAPTLKKTDVDFICDSIKRFYN